MAIHIGQGAAVPTATAPGLVEKIITFVLGTFLSIVSGVATVVATFATWLFAMQTVQWCFPQAWSEFHNVVAPGVPFSAASTGVALALLRVIVVALK